MSAGSRSTGLILVTSAGKASGPGRDAVLSFNAAGQLVGRFSEDPRIVDPRGLTLDPPGELIYVNTMDRMLALDQSGQVVRDSGSMAHLDPGGAVFGPDGRFYVTMRRRGTILGMSASLEGEGEPVVPEGIVPFPRGFAFGRDGSLYLASGIGPSGEGDNTIVVFEPDALGRARPLVRDAGLSPLDMTLAPNGHIVVASESPFGAPDALVTIREYDPSSGDLVRVFSPNAKLNFRQPRGLRLGRKVVSTRWARLT